MKRILFLSIMLIAFTFLSGCNFDRTPTESLIITNEDSTIPTIQPTQEPSLDPIATEIIPSEEPVLAIEDLYTKFHEAEASNDYVLALHVANQIISEYPEEQRIYWLKAQMLISSLKFFNNELKLLIDEYSTDYQDYMEDRKSVV